MTSSFFPTLHWRYSRYSTPPRLFLFLFLFFYFLRLPHKHPLFCFFFLLYSCVGFCVCVEELELDCHQVSFSIGRYTFFLFGSSWERCTAVQSTAPHRDSLGWFCILSGFYLSISPRRARDGLAWPGLVTTLMTMLKMYMSKAMLS